MSKKKKPANSPAQYELPAVTKKFRQAMGSLRNGDLVPAVGDMLQILKKHPESEEAYFAVNQIQRLKKLYPDAMKEANFDGENFDELKTARKGASKMDLGIKVTVGFLFVAMTWMILLLLAPRMAMLGQMAEVPLIFRTVSGIGGLLAGYIAWGFLNLRWEAVTFFIIWIPVVLIITFIGLVESPTWGIRILTGLTFAAEIFAAWCVSKRSHHFVY